MTDLDGLMDATTAPMLAPTAPMLAPAKPRTCRRHDWFASYRPDPVEGSEVRVWECLRCSAVRDAVASRRGRNNRKRGNGAELTVARGLNARKMGPLGLPWDVEMAGYARIQVKKLANPPSLRAIVGMLAAIGTGAEMPGVIWIEPGRGGERLIVFRLADFAERHGVPTGGDE